MVLSIYMLFYVKEKSIPQTTIILYISIIVVNQIIILILPLIL
jgi:hypothetical protein